MLPRCLRAQSVSSQQLPQDDSTTTGTQKHPWSQRETQKLLRATVCLFFSDYLKRAAAAGRELAAFPPPQTSRSREVSSSPADALSASHQQISQVNKP